LNQPGKTKLMTSVNAAIAEFAGDYAERFDSVESLWWFVCECGSPECSAHVDLELAAYEAIRAEPGGLVLAHGHYVAGAKNEKPPFAAAS
jgi:hypothetical protein